MSSDDAHSPLGFFLRAAACWAAFTLPVARVLGPGLRGNAGDRAVVAWQLVAASSSYALALVLSTVAAIACALVLRKDHPLRRGRALVLLGTMTTVALVAPAFVRRLPAQPSIVIALVASMVVIHAATRLLAFAATRAVAIVLAAFALAALLRLFGWQLAVAAGERVSSSMYGVSRGLATAAVALEAIGQLTVVVWLGTRRHFASQLLTGTAVALGFAFTWGATLGVHHDAPAWQAVLHTALAEAAGLPAPFALGAAATFLLATSFPLAFVAAGHALRRGEEGTLAAAVAILLVAQGAFDVPIRALAAVTAAAALLSSFPLADVGLSRRAT